MHGVPDRFFKTGGFILTTRRKRLKRTWGKKQPVKFVCPSIREQFYFIFHSRAGARDVFEPKLVPRLHRLRDTMRTKMSFTLPRYQSPSCTLSFSSVARLSAVFAITDFHLRFLIRSTSHKHKIRVNFLIVRRLIQDHILQRQTW